MTAFPEYSIVFEVGEDDVDKVTVTYSNDDSPASVDEGRVLVMASIMHAIETPDILDMLVSRFIGDRLGVEVKGVEWEDDSE